MTEEAFWEVRIALEDGWMKLPPHLHMLVPSERWWIVLASEDDGAEATLHVNIPATGHGEAEEKAECVYMEALKLAGLPARSPLLIGVLPPILGDTSWARLLKEADRHLQSGRFDFAVVRAQTAAEVYAAPALEHLSHHMRKEGQKARSLFGRSSLTEPKGRHLLLALTGVTIDQQDWWPKYMAHLDRRNGIVHEGLVVSRGEATHSLEAVHRYINCMGWLWAGKPDEPFDYARVS